MNKHFETGTVGVGVHDDNGLELVECCLGDVIKVCKSYPYNGCMLRTKKPEQVISIHTSILVQVLLSGSSMNGRSFNSWNADMKLTICILDVAIRRYGLAEHNSPASNRSRGGGFRINSWQWAGRRAEESGTAQIKPRQRFARPKRRSLDLSDNLSSSKFPADEPVSRFEPSLNFLQKLLEKRRCLWDYWKDPDVGEIRISSSIWKSRRRVQW